MVDMQCSTILARSYATETTALISCYNDCPDTTPTWAVHKPSPSAIVGVILPDRPVFSTGMATKTTPSFGFTCESAECLTTLLANKLCCSDQPGIAARHRAMANELMARLESLAACFANGNDTSCLTPSLMTSRGTEMFGGLLGHASWALKGFAALMADQVNRALLSFRLAFASAERYGAVVGLETLMTLGANLDH